MARQAGPHPQPITTPDGRYIVVRGRLWRTSNRTLPASEREDLVKQLMDARRAVKTAAADPAALKAARRAVDAAKRGLGERGPVWWKDGAPDFNRHLVKNSPYAQWYAERQATDSFGNAGERNDSRTVKSREPNRETSMAAKKKAKKSAKKTTKTSTKTAVKRSPRGRAQDRARVAGGQKYEVAYEAKKTKKSASAVRKAVKRIGNSRKKVGKALRGR